MVAWHGLVAASGPATQITLSNQTVTAAQLGSTATAIYKLDNDGDAYQNIGGTYTSLESWIDNPALVSGYECLATVVSGSPTGTTGSWLALSTDREWSVSDSVQDGSPTTAQLQIQIRSAASMTVLATATITLSAENLS